jgi:transposase
MASITRQTVGNNTYLYESHSFRNEEGKPRNTKIKIGKIDKRTGRALYNQEYIDRMHEAGTPVIIPETDMTEQTEGKVYEALDNIKSYGLFYFLEKVAEKIKLIKILKQALPKYWKEICNLCFYIIASDKPLAYMEDWLSENESYPTGKMSSQRLSELLAAFGQKEQNNFYQLWNTENESDEYMALDITSISSYSKQILDNERGYNRDGENLSQINLCLLFGEETKLPVYQTIYSGSIMDVATLSSTVAEMEAVKGRKKLIFVLDKGFYGEKNIKNMIEKQCEFLMAVPFSNNWSKELVNNERSKIDRATNLITTLDSPWRGISKKINFSDYKLTAHLFYDPERAVKYQNYLYDFVSYLKQMVQNGQQPSACKNDFEKYLKIGKNNSVHIREDVLERELATNGWFLMLGNGKISTQKAYDIYSKKDVVEKAFMKYKNLLGFQRLRVHSDLRMRNKLFIGFIAMIVVSHIHKVMKEKELYTKMTMEKLLITLSKIKKTMINGSHIIRPLTREQREIFYTFSIPFPFVG